MREYTSFFGRERGKCVIFYFFPDEGDRDSFNLQKNVNLDPSPSQVCTQYFTVA